MKKHSPSFLVLLLTSLMSVVAFTSCSDNGNEPEPAEPAETPADATSVHFQVYPEAVSQTSPTIRLTAMTNDWSVTEISNPKHPERQSMLFLNNTRHIGQLVTLDTDGITFIDYDPTSGETGNSAMIVTENSGGYVVALCNVNSTLSDMEVVETITLTTTTDKKSAARKNDDMDFAREILDKRLTELSNQISKLENFPSEAGSVVCKFWTDLAIPFMRLNLYSNDREKMEEITKKYISDKTDESVKNYLATVKLPDKADTLIDMSKRFVSAFKYGYDLADTWESEPEFNDKWATENTSKISDVSQRTVIFVPQVSAIVDRYTVHTSVSDVGKTGAALSGSVDINDYSAGYVSEWGFELSGTDGTNRNISVSNFNNAKYAGNLTPGTRYTATAYIRSMEITYRGNSVSFTTDAEFSVDPTTITFGPEKSSRGVSVTLPDNTWSWEITDKPSWCKITKGEMSFFVDVAASSTNRSGNIIVTGKSRAGDTKSCTISVSQMGMWYFSGSVTTTTTTSKGDSNSYQTDGVTMMLRGAKGSYHLTGTTFLSGVLFIDWAVSGSKRPTLVSSDYKFTSFSSTTSGSKITISGKVAAQGGTVSFSIAIDLGKGSITYNESGEWRDTDYYGNPTWVRTSVDGTLHLTEMNM